MFLALSFGLYILVGLSYYVLVTYDRVGGRETVRALDRKGERVLDVLDHRVVSSQCSHRLAILGTK
jgi:hypothetical protein